ncbi:prepilin-type N-terminal cleavage/methylation domain-containing protein [Guyparkeria sp. SCN-R1]|uniref:GspH/FimT family pseudopilin n=1 Tax=Guyparkeria sp. SCN-R1 TaxID=2341113 RepID=UPI000F64C251|nr:GspH/FimT family pseudopilin [Guyparkeria sp. SCN-R1]RRQ23562.1 prepilin-type N-terminal cleavage/methylation domain-containing protein [Guyparkeria sp. SCN-R1]
MGELTARQRAAHASGTAASPRQAGGFSLIELMVTVSVAAVLLAIAIPAFSSMMAQNQLAAATNAARGALMAARQSAVLQGRPVSICAGTPDAGCTGDWSPGEWLVFQDADHDGDLGDGERVVRHGRVPAAGGAVSLDGNGPFRSALVYVPMGHAERVSGAFGAGRLRVCVAADLSPNARELVISASGRVRLQVVDLDGACPSL